jgi:anti-sigma factor ChrR (cupin superfamily)
MFTCRDASEHMTDEGEGALTGARRFWYRVHVTICPYCRTCRRQFEATVRLTRDIPAEGAPDRVVDAALEAFRARSKDRL